MDVQHKLRELKEMYEGGLITAAVYDSSKKWYSPVTPVVMYQQIRNRLLLDPRC